MGKGGGGGTTQSTGTTYTTNVPEYAEPYVHTMLGATQKQLFDMRTTQDRYDPDTGVLTPGTTEITGFKPYKPYSTDPSAYVAPFSPTQQQAFEGIRQLGPSQLGQVGGQLAGAATMGALGTGYDPYRMGQFTSERAAQYMNPFLETAMEPQLREAQRASEVQRTIDQAQATRAGAFGGGRQAIVEAERQRNLGTQMGDIRARGYQTAFDQAQQNFAREQQMREQSRQYGAGLGMQGLQTALQGAGQMGTLGQQEFGQRQAALGMQQQVGSMQQSLEQQKINQAIQDFANAQQYPLMQLGTMSNMLRGLPMQAQTTNQYVAAPNPITQGIGVAGAGASIYNALKAEGGVIKEMAEGGIASVPRYDVGGEVYSDLTDMSVDQLRNVIRESSSQRIKEMAKGILAEKAAQRMYGGGIVAFQRGGVPSAGSVEPFESQADLLQEYRAFNNLLNSPADFKRFADSARKESGRTDKDEGYRDSDIRRMVSYSRDRRGALINTAGPSDEMSAGEAEARLTPPTVPLEPVNLGIAGATGPQAAPPTASRSLAPAQAAAEAPLVGGMFTPPTKNADDPRIGQIVEYYKNNLAVASGLPLNAGKHFSREVVDRAQEEADATLRRLEENFGMRLASARPPRAQTAPPVVPQAEPAPAAITAAAQPAPVVAPAAAPAGIMEAAQPAPVEVPAGGAATADDRAGEAEAQGAGITSVAPPPAAAPVAPSGATPSAERVAGEAEARAGTAPVTAEPTFTGTLADAQRAEYEARTRANRPVSAFLEDIETGKPENTAVAEYRKQVMAERANAKDEAERQRHMRLAQFFAKWGSTPGPTLAAGLNALEKTIPDLISDEKEQKKIKRELDKVMYDIDNSIRLEKLGDMKEARALKEKAADRAQQLQERLMQVQQSEEASKRNLEGTKFSANAQVRAAEIRAKDESANRAQRSGEIADAKRFSQYQVASEQERRTLERIAFEENGDQHKADLKTAALRNEKGEIPAGMEKKVAEAQGRINERQKGWTARAQAARSNTDMAYGRLGLQTSGSPAGAGAAASSAPTADRVAGAAASLGLSNAPPPSGGTAPPSGAAAPSPGATAPKPQPAASDAANLPNVARVELARQELAQAQQFLVAATNSKDTKAIERYAADVARLQQKLNALTR
jgi:hypothetical protein